MTVTSGPVFLSPYSMGAPSIPGAMAITDADDGFSLSRAFPVSTGFDHPVMWINPGTPNDERAWGEVKALYR